MSDPPEACLQRERRRHHQGVEELRELLALHGISLDAVTLARWSVGVHVNLEWRCFAYSEAVAAGVVYG